MNRMKNDPILAIVVPCYNEGPVIDNTTTRLVSILNGLIENNSISKMSFICFVDDGSRDNTWEKIIHANKIYPNIKGIKFTKNEGHQNALLAGLLYAKKYCDCAISIDADLQQDESVIPEFINKYKNGADIVFGIRKNRSTDSLIKKVTADFFYKFMNIMNVKIIKNHADFRLLSKKAVDALSEYNESNLFLRGIISNMGFTTDKVLFDVKKRFAGKTKYTLRKMISFAVNGITSFSIMPLRFVTIIGFILFLFSAVMGMYILTEAVIIQKAIPGWASTVLPIYFLGGVQLLCLGIVGEYIGKTYQEVKARPRYIIEEKLK